MNVILTDITEDPITKIAQAAGTSTNRVFNFSKRTPKERVEECYKKGHMNVFEFVDATFYVTDISRVTTHQLVRHRLASDVERSHRYTTVECANPDYCIIPESIAQRADICAMFVQQLRGAAGLYQIMLQEGIKPEDARYILPEGTKTGITVKTNLREYWHIFDMRTDIHAQWEIREMASRMIEALKNVSDDWKWLMELYTGSPK